MVNIIKLLPDSVANQIAAGEVIQRPASVVKELVENSVDAESSVITVHIKDSGRTLIQVIDNGLGMSPTDARMSFERHATSKISCAEDIFTIRTKGFRGEALASIAAVAQVELKTRRIEDELGTAITINGSVVESQEPVQQAVGSNFMVKNLFYNIPVRREFLKSDNYEFSLIIEEFQRVAIAHPDVQFLLYHNDREVYNLPKSNLIKRITNLFGKQYEKNLIPVEINTSLVSLSGYISKPEIARKKSSDQYFVVNDRFIKHRIFYGAVMRAYQNILIDRMQPPYFLFFNINPGEIDVNIHPTKTEVKFKQESQICTILESVIKESLGKFSINPSLDFEDDTNYNDMFRQTEGSVKMPSIEINPTFNPFNPSNSLDTTSKNTYRDSKDFREVENISNWENLFKGFENNARREPEIFQSALNLDTQTKTSDVGSYMQFRSKYVITVVKSGVMLIDQKRAHERVLYERYMQTLKQEKMIIQNMLHPHIFEVNPADYLLLKEALAEFRILGFDIEDFGKNTFAINGIPVDLKTSDIDSKLNDMLLSYRDFRQTGNHEVKESVARSLAKVNAIEYGVNLSSYQIQELINDLFSCKSPNISPEGKKVVYVLENDEIASKFN